MTALARLALAGLLAASPLLAGGPASANGPARVVVAGGDLAEIAFALGAGDRVVGTDSTATYPDAADALPEIGYMRRLSAEGVLSLAPDLLLAAPDAGPALALEQIAGAGVAVSLAPDVMGPDGIAPKIRFVGASLGVEAEAEALAAWVEREMAAVAAKVARLGARPRVLFVLFLRDGTPVVGGAETEADAILRLAGAENAAGAVSGYRPMNREAIVAAAPEALLMMEGRAEEAGGLAAVLARPDFALTPAGRDGRAVAMPGMLLLGFGPRTPEAVARLARLLHPEAAAAAGL